jgi:hypothetical protein
MRSRRSSVTATLGIDVDFTTLSHSSSAHITESRALYSSTNIGHKRKLKRKRDKRKNKEDEGCVYNE